MTLSDKLAEDVARWQLGWNEYGNGVALEEVLRYKDALELAVERHHATMQSAMEMGYLDRDIGEQGLRDYAAAILATLEGEHATET